MSKHTYDRGVDDQPRIEIGSWPTPVVRLEKVSEALGAEVWAKLEDRCGTWGGNKVRKLEYMLATARRDGVEKLVGFGAGTSNWTSALAFHATPLGFEVEVRITTNEVPPSYDRLYRVLGTRVVPRHPARWYAEAHVLPRRSGGRVRYLPLGGSGGEGDLGSMRAGIEISDAIAAGEMPRPSAIFVAAGTGGTAAGVAVGAGVRRIDSRVVCVRVTTWPYGTAAHVRWVARSLQKRCGVQGSDMPPLAGDGTHAAPGYARPNAESVEAAEVASLDGLVLDQTYGAKAFASLLAHARSEGGGPYLFLHTSPGDPPPPPGER